MQLSTPSPVSFFPSLVFHWCPAQPRIYSLHVAACMLRQLRLLLPSSLSSPTDPPYCHATSHSRYNVSSCTLANLAPCIGCFASCSAAHFDPIHAFMHNVPPPLRARSSHPFRVKRMLCSRSLSPSAAAKPRSISPVLVGRLWAAPSPINRIAIPHTHPRCCSRVGTAMLAQFNAHTPNERPGG